VAEEIIFQQAEIGIARKNELISFGQFVLKLSGFLGFDAVSA
jgi:hypothetical protein